MPYPRAWAGKRKYSFLSSPDNRFSYRKTESIIMNEELIKSV
jgi:hypothetical protein